MEAALATKPDKLRLLIVGLLDRQFAIIRDEFPGLDLDHVSSGNASTSEDVERKQRKAAKVLVITKFISHSMFYGVDRAKIAYFNGIDALRQMLASFAANSYAAQKVSPLIKRNEDGSLRDMGAPMCDYSPLRTAKVGDVLSFVRPEGIPAHLFVQNVESAREYYARHYGVETTQDVLGGKAEVVVRNVATPKLNEAEAIMEEGRDWTYRLPSIEEQARHFWRVVYREAFSLMPYASPAVFAQIANCAVDGWLAAIGHNSED